MIVTGGAAGVANRDSHAEGSRAGRFPLVLALLAMQTYVGTAAAQERPPQIDDLRERAVAILSIDPADEDFSDLAPLATAIGDARIVQLGESSHTAGRTFSAKARLVKFLHGELGFDVLVWESGMYDLRTADDSLRAGADPVESAQLGIFSIWSATQEVLPLLEYARASHRQDRPLEMAGMDIQFSGRDAWERFREDLVRFAAAAESGAVRDRARSLTARVTDGFGKFVADGAAPTDADLESFLETADELLELIRAERSSFLRGYEDREVAFMERVLGNLRQEGIREYSRTASTGPEEGPEATAVQNRSWNLRDVRMADNLLWLARERYPDRKLIVWAHNGHIMDAYYTPDWDSLSLTQRVEGGMKPMGSFVAEEMGDSVYTIAFTAFAGEHGSPTMMPERIEPAPAGSLEALLHELGHEHAFIDFRAVPADHWLRRPMTMAIRGYEPELMDDWTQIVDGIFFIDRMAPSTFGPK